MPDYPNQTNQSTILKRIVAAIKSPLTVLISENDFELETVIHLKNAVQTWRQRETNIDLASSNTSYEDLHMLANQLQSP